MVKRHKRHYGEVSGRIGKEDRERRQAGFDITRMREKIGALVYLIRAVAAEARVKSKRKWFQDWARRLEEVAEELTGV